MVSTVVDGSSRQVSRMDLSQQEAFNQAPLRKAEKARRRLSLTYKPGRLA